ncbi:MAG: hypothetical protein QM783_02675 [Phycisphaerales bacterium]
MTSSLIQPWMYFIVAPLAALGLIGLYCSLFKGRAKGRQRCPKCWYDLKGVNAPTKCPECGREIATRNDLLRTRRHWGSALLSLALIVPLGIVFGKLHAMAVYYAVMPKWKAVQEVEWNGTTITRFRVRNPDEFGERVLVRAGGNHFLDYEDHSISLNGYDHSRETLVDLDPASGDEIKECVIECYSGGAHCCYRVYVVKLLAMGPQIVADIDAHNGLAVQPPATPLGEWLFNIPDQAFDYWKVSHAESPMPAVYYHLSDGELRVALDEMDSRMSLSQAEALANDSTVVGAQDAAGNTAPFVWKTVLDLLYAGYDEQAWAFFDRACRADKAAGEKFRAEFLHVLADDPWYQDVKDARAARAAKQPIPVARIGKSGKAATP